MTTVEAVKHVTRKESIQESTKRIKQVVRTLYEDIATVAEVMEIPNIHISKTYGDAAAYLPGENLIILNAVALQNQSFEVIAYILAHEVWHHRQWEDGERFEGYITPSADKSGYENQPIEQEANDFAASLFPDALNYMEVK